jgi:hypothetical protein
MRGLADEEDAGFQLPGANQSVTARLLCVRNPPQARRFSLQKLRFTACRCELRSGRPAVMRG